MNQVGLRNSVPYRLHPQRYLSLLAILPVDSRQMPRQRHGQCRDQFVPPLSRSTVIGAQIQRVTQWGVCVPFLPPFAGLCALEQCFLLLSLPVAEGETVFPVQGPTHQRQLDYSKNAPGNALPTDSYLGHAGWCECSWAKVEPTPNLHRAPQHTKKSMPVAATHRLHIQQLCNSSLRG